MNNHRLTNVTAIMTIFVVLLLSLFCMGNPAYADDVVEHKEVSTFNGLSQAVVRNLILVYQIGKEVLGNNAEYLQAIMMQESRGIGGLVGNKSAPPSKRSYGLMQVQIPSARSILRSEDDLMDRYFPRRSIKQVKDGEIEQLLLRNNEANIRIAAHHYRRDVVESRSNMSKSLASYNLGSGGVKRIKNYEKFAYVIGVNQYLKRVVRPFNEQYNYNVDMI